jgi:hypothetical protein
MPAETASFQHGPDTFRIQFDIIAPPPVPAAKPGAIKSYTPKPQYRVQSIRIREMGDHLGDNARKLNVNFDRGFDSLGAARSGATEYAKRIVREKMTPKKAPAAAAAETPVAEPVAATPSAAPVIAEAASPAADPVVTPTVA